MDDLPTIIVIFGGTGDLTWRMLIPSLFDLHRDGRMPKKFAIIAVGRSPHSDLKLRQRFLAGVKRFSRKGKVKSTDWNAFAKHVVDADPALVPEDEAILVDTRDRLLAVGRMALPAADVKAFSRGIAVKTRHPRPTLSPSRSMAATTGAVVPNRQC